MAGAGPERQRLRQPVQQQPENVQRNVPDADAMNSVTPLPSAAGAASHAAAPAHADIALSEFFDGNPVPTFAIDTHHVITHWNRACEHLLGWSKADMIGTSNHWQAFYPKPRPVLADLIIGGSEGELDLHYPGKYRASS